MIKREFYKHTYTITIVSEFDLPDSDPLTDLIVIYDYNKKHKIYNDYSINLNINSNQISKEEAMQFVLDQEDDLLHVLSVDRNGNDIICPQCECTLAHQCFCV